MELMRTTLCALQVNEKSKPEKVMHVCRLTTRLLRKGIRNSQLKYSVTGTI